MMTISQQQNSIFPAKQYQPQITQIPMNNKNIKAQTISTSNKEDTPRNTHNLFFIKSKHAFKEYKNHDYFEQTPFLNMRQSIATKCNQEFVGSPAPYGIDNAYNYICEEISKNHSQKSRPVPKRMQTQIQFSKQHRTKNRSFINERPRKSNYTLPNLRDDKKSQLMIQGGIDTKSKLMQSIGLKFPKQVKEAKSQYLISLIYIDPLHTVNSNENCELKLNIYEYIINTFLKTRINYHEITQKQFELIKDQILRVYKMAKEQVEYKDLVNARSISEIFQLLEWNKSNSSFCRQIYRYFFIPSEEVYIYQFNKIKDQLKTLINFQFNKQIGTQEIYIFDTHSGNLIHNLHQLISYQPKFVFGTDLNAIDLYRNHLKQKQEKNKLAIRIKKWKSIAPQETVYQNSFQTITTQKYHKLFNTVQKRRDRFLSRKKAIVSLRSSQFVQRDKLFKDQSIFQ